MLDVDAPYTGAWLDDIADEDDMAAIIELDETAGLVYTAGALDAWPDVAATIEDVELTPALEDDMVMPPLPAHFDACIVPRAKTGPHSHLSRGIDIYKITYPCLPKGLATKSNMPDVQRFFKTHGHKQ